MKNSRYPQGNVLSLPASRSSRRPAAGLRLYPLFADLRGRGVLVSGGGDVAERKIAALLDAGARITVCAPDVSMALQQRHARGEIRWHKGAFNPSLLEDAWLVVAATDNRDANRTLARHAHERRLFVNVVDDPELSSFHVPAIVDRSPILIAISSAGAAPMLARRLRQRLEAQIHPAIGRLAALVQPLRHAIVAARRNLRARREFYDWLLDGPVAQAVYRNRMQDARSALNRALESSAPQPRGRVVIVGAGPGDPGLLTLHALQALNDADVILFDRLVHPDILALARRDAQRVNVGKRPGEDHDATQSRIHARMRDAARTGQVVVRLKGGDPFVFGRGGEELEFLRRHGIAYSVVPGITAAFAAAAYAGIALTHRDHSAAITLVSAQRKSGSDADTDFVDPGGTLAFYMGSDRLQVLARTLLTHGRAPDTPFALVENATLEAQNVRYGCLRDLARDAAPWSCAGPAVLLVGEVTALGPGLQWFGRQATRPFDVVNPDGQDTIPAAIACSSA